MRPTSLLHAVFIYTALPCEAKPIIEYFRLKKDLNAQAFAVFRRENICLTVTGIGKSAMAAGLAYSQALFATSSYPVLLNVGIAGHKEHPLGSLFLLNKITDGDSQRAYYPPLVIKPPCATASVISNAKPQLVYSHDELCDMEASAFYETATRFSTGELIHCLKVISDNQHHPVTQINAQAASALIARHLDVIVQLLGQLSELAVQLNVDEPQSLQDLLARHRFSVNGQQQLKAKLMRLELMGRQVVSEEMAELRSGKEVLKCLDQKLGDLSFYL